MNLSGLKNFLGNIAELSKNYAPDFIAKNSTGNRFLIGNFHNTGAVQAMTNRFLEARSAKNSARSSFDKTEIEKTYPPKAIIILLKNGVPEATREELSRRVVQATLEQNGIAASNIEMEELMALPQNREIDLNNTFDKNWNSYSQPGLMPSAGKYKDINGKERFGYKMTLSPNWQADIVGDYKQIRSELAKTENVGRKAVIDMQMPERLRETLKIAWQKGYISDEVWKQLGSLTANELIITFGVGGLLGQAAATELGGTVLGPVGGVLLASAGAKTAMDFAKITDKMAAATSREQLDQPARELGELLGAIPKDAILAAVGTLGGITTSKAMPAVEKALTKQTAKIKQSTPKFDEPILVTPEGIKVKMPKTPLEKISEPKKIVSVDSNGKPSGTRFRDDYQSHIKERDFSNSSQKRGVNGAHNKNEFEQYDITINPKLTKDSIKILTKTPHPTVKGIYKVEYEMPKLNGKLQIVGWRLDKGKPFIKTVYDSKIISDKQMAQWGREAFADAVQNKTIDLAKREWTGQASNGLKIFGYLDAKGTMSVRTFFPDF